MSPRLALVAFSMALLSASASGCGGGSSCAPGQSVACACTDGRMGAQVCESDHSFGPCTCTGGNDMATSDGAPQDMTPPPPKRVFVTKTVYAATAAPTVCQSSADAAGLGGTWVPWLSAKWSTGNDNAITTVTSNGSWALVTGEVAFQTRGQLGTTPSVPINVTETGTTLPMNEGVWTGTLTGGTASDYTCQGWTENRNIFAGTVGNVSSTDGWSNSSYDNCSASHHVYCFEL
jgi:hypothetical protein